MRKKMFTVDINNVPVKFPFEPYTVQIEYMEKVIESLDSSQNACLESPTGTGKTLSLLCSTMAWVEKLDPLHEPTPRVRNFSRNASSSNLNKSYCTVTRTIPQVIYATRTHTQIIQAIKELKSTAYTNFKATVIGSRDQFCINDDLQEKSNSDKIYMCKSLVANTNNSKKPLCDYYEKIAHKDDYIERCLRPLEQNQRITDIEDLKNIGRSHSCCPYFMSKTAAKNADIIFLPYSYLIDPKLREISEIDLSGAIVILDEAHNVSQVCEDCSSASIEERDTRTALREINHIIHNGLGVGHDLKILIQKLNDAINDISIGTHPGSLIFELLENVGIKSSEFSFIINKLDDFIERLADHSFQTRRLNANAIDDPNQIRSPPNGSGLKKLLYFLQTVSLCSTMYNRRSRKIDRAFKVHIESKRIYHNQDQNQDQIQEQDRNQNTAKFTKVLHFWCFSPEFRMKDLMQQNIRCLILTSSTLAPFMPMLSEMKIPMPIQQINGHVVKRYQVCAKILSSGVDKQMMDSTFNNRENDAYLASLGKSIAEFAKVIPGGLLIFFPSYELMNDCIRFWRNHRIWPEIEREKPTFIESPEKTPFEIAIKNYCRLIGEDDREKRHNGAILMAVLRAKVSEGIDFSDMYGRAVLIIGVPFPPHPKENPKIELKWKYLDENRTLENQMLSGRQWYTWNAIKAVNQAIGRVIRHKNDYGAMILCDYRFNLQDNKRDISLWVQGHLNDQRSYELRPIIEEVSTFFNTVDERLERSNPRDNPESIIIYDEN